MTLPDIIFVPKYQKKQHASIAGCFVFLMLTLIFGAVGAIPTDLYLISILFCGIGLFIIPYSMYRKITFGETIKMERYLGTRTISYQDIRDIGHRFIRISRTSIDLASMTNGDELRQIFQDLVASGRIPQDQLAHKLAREEQASLAVLPLSLIINTVLSSILLLTGYYPRQIDFSWFCLGIWVVIYVIMYQIKKATMK